MVHDTPLILASASPRRREILARAEISFEVIPANLDEARQPGEAPAELVERLAREKARFVASRHGQRFVLGADTIVNLGDRVLGKPRDEAHALELLSSLSGRTHRVLTGVALVTPAGGVLSRWVSSEVTFRDADRDELERYVAAGESLDKAGAYALQGEGHSLVEKVRGSETNVIGLPLDETLALLGEGGFGRADR